MSIETHAGDPRLPRHADEGLDVYMERYSKWLAQFKPWEHKAETQEVRTPYVDREPGSDDD